MNTLDTNYFKNAIAHATEEGNKAGMQWLVEHTKHKNIMIALNGDSVHLTDMNGTRINPMLDLCGNAYIELKDKRTKFAKYLKAQSKNNQVYSVSIDHIFRGWQDMGLKEATIRAAYDVLTKVYGLTGINYKTYID